MSPTTEAASVDATGGETDTEDEPDASPSLPPTPEDSVLKPSQMDDYLIVELYTPKQRRWFNMKTAGIWLVVIAIWVVPFILVGPGDDFEKTQTIIGLSMVFVASLGGIAFMTVHSLRPHLLILGPEGFMVDFVQPLTPRIEIEPDNFQGLRTIVRDGRWDDIENLSIKRPKGCWIPAFDWPNFYIDLEHELSSEDRQWLIDVFGEDTRPLS